MNPHFLRAHHIEQTELFAEGKPIRQQDKETLRVGERPLKELITRIDDLEYRSRYYGEHLSAREVFTELKELVEQLRKLV